MAMRFQSSGSLQIQRPFLQFKIVMLWKHHASNNYHYVHYLQYFLKDAILQMGQSLVVLA
jgi:hypothetical protein